MIFPRAGHQLAMVYMSYAMLNFDEVYIIIQPLLLWQQSILSLNYHALLNLWEDTIVYGRKNTTYKCLLA